MLAKVCRYPGPGNAPEPTAGFLYRGHEWKREKHGPQHGHAKLTAHLRIGGDPAGVIVGCSGDQSWSQTQQKIATPATFWRGATEGSRRGYFGHPHSPLGRRIVSPASITR
jgi:hypothetical protein